MMRGNCDFVEVGCRSRSFSRRYYRDNERSRRIHDFRQGDPGLSERAEAGRRAAVPRPRRVLLGGMNLADEEYRTHAFDLSACPGLELGYYNPPRTWSLTGSDDF
jgi:hypothetical protein